MNRRGIKNNRGSYVDGRLFETRFSYVILFSDKNIDLYISSWWKLLWMSNQTFDESGRTQAIAP